MSSLLWRDKPVTIPPIKHWKRHIQMHGGSRLSLQHLVCDLTGCWCPLHPSEGVRSTWATASGRPAASLIPSLTVLACTLGTDSKRTAAFSLLVAVDAPCLCWCHSRAGIYSHDLEKLESQAASLGWVPGRRDGTCQRTRRINCFFEFTCGFALTLLWIRFNPECFNLIWKWYLHSVVSSMDTNDIGMTLYWQHFTL